MTYRGIGERFITTKYQEEFLWCLNNPGEEKFLVTLANQHSAVVQAWRIKNNFYHDGIWKARTTKAGQVFVTYVGEDDG